MNPGNCLPRPTGIRPIPAAVGVELKPQHHDWIIQHRPQLPWLEVPTESFMGHSPLRAELEIIARHYPLALHGSGLSIGSVHLPQHSHLQQLRELVLRFEPDLVSDHLSWSAVAGTYLPDFLPLPYTQEALHVVVRNVHRVQEVLGREILLENTARYGKGPAAELSEAEFLAEVVLRTGCGVLLDVNNLRISAATLGTPPVAELEAFLCALPAESFAELHVSGGSADASVWALYQSALAQLGPVPTLIEWDTGLPEFAQLLEAAAVARAHMDLYAPGADLAVAS